MSLPSTLLIIGSSIFDIRHLNRNRIKYQISHLTSLWRENNMAGEFCPSALATHSLPPPQMPSKSEFACWHVPLRSVSMLRNSALCCAMQCFFNHFFFHLFRDIFLQDHGDGRRRCNGVRMVCRLPWPWYQVQQCQ